VVTLSKVYLLAGVSGVGKSSVATRALEIIEDLKAKSDLQRSIDAVLRKGGISPEEADSLRHLSVKRVNFGEVLFRIAKEKKIAKTKQDLRSLPAGEIHELQKAAVAEIKRMRGTILVDMHLTVWTPQGIVAGLPISSAEEISPEVIILLEADPQEVFKRRVKDSKEGDTPEGITLDALREHMGLDRAAAICIATVAGLRIKTVKNINVDDAAYEVARSMA
jgi:adenylate kinase